MIKFYALILLLKLLPTGTIAVSLIGTPVGMATLEECNTHLARLHTIIRDDDPRAKIVLSDCKTHKEWKKELGFDPWKNQWEKLEKGQDL